MKSIFDILSSLLNKTQSIEIKKLPTQGIFYPNDFKIKIKKASVEDIIEYEYFFKPESVLEIIDIIKRFVRKNIIFSKPYTFDDLKSIDIVFIFLEIVRFTNNKPVKINYFDINQKQNLSIDFNYRHFNYFDFSKFKDKYLKDEQCIDMGGWKFSMPSIGVENCVTNFLLEKVNDDNAEFYNSQNYDFLFFIGNKNNLSYEEIENLIIIFNQDITEDDKKELKSIIKQFHKLIGYTLKIDNKIIDLKSNLDLENIWKD